MNRKIARSARLALAGLVVCLMAASAGAAGAQEVRDFGTTGRGRLGDGATLMAAQDAADRAGLDCRVDAAAARGRDVNGDRQYEVSCGEAPGFLIVDEPRAQATSCLVLAGDRSAACRLPGNRDPRRHFARMAEAAGADCVVEAGRLAGRGEGGGLVFEVGCRGPEGYWLEGTAGGWSAIDCLTVRGQGGGCELTPPSEDAAAFRTRLGADGLPGCQVRDVRLMGRSEAGTYFEVACAGADPRVARFEAGALAEVIPCAEAARIGDGCRLEDEREGRAPHDDPAM